MLHGLNSKIVKKRRLYWKKFWGHSRWVTDGKRTQRGQEREETILLENNWRMVKAEGIIEIILSLTIEQKIDQERWEKAKNEGRGWWKMHMCDCFYQWRKRTGKEWEEMNEE